MQLLAVGLNHTTAPVSLREKLAFSPDQIGPAVVAARSWFGRDGFNQQTEVEAAILSTCNRTEVYVQAPHRGHARAALENVLRLQTGMDALSEHLYYHESEDAVEHLFSGLHCQRPVHVEQRLPLRVARKQIWVAYRVAHHQHRLPS